MNDLIVSMAVDGREKYSELVKELEKSIVDSNWNGDVRIYKEFPIWCTPHSEVPYKFKYDIIERAYTDGYDRIFWLDSTMRLIYGRNISDLLSQSKCGVVAFDNLGHNLVHYINDTAVEYLGLKELEGLRQCWGGALFFDFNETEAKELFFSVLEASTSGAFNDDNTKRIGFYGHRHDQAVVSGYLYLFDIPMLDYGVIAAPKDVTDKTYIIYGDTK
jgi:hypothetical protein